VNSKHILATKEDMIPHSIKIEKNILADVLLNKDNLPLIFYKVRSYFFYLEIHQYIFKAAKEIYENQMDINIDTVADHLKASGYLEKIGGIKELLNIINSVIIVNNIETYIIILIDKYIRRQIICGAKKIEKLAYQSFDSIETLLDEAEKVLFTITEDKPNNNLFLTSEVLLEVFIDLEKRSKENLYCGLKSGFFELDAITQGFQQSDLVIIAGRPSMGKTAFALNIARNVSELQDTAIIIFSLEMSRQQLVYRFLSKESQIAHSKLRSGNINKNEWYAVSKAINVLANLKIYLDDSGELSLSSIRNKINNIQIKHQNIGLIVIDYLQLLNDPSVKDSRVQELSKLTRGLKVIAKEFNVPTIVLSQLSRNVESRTNKRPILSDLRESGCIAGEMKLYIPYKNEYLNINKIEHKINNFVISNLNTKIKQSLLFSTAKIKRNFYTGTKFTYILKLINNNIITITGNHKLLTIKGWKKVKNLSRNDLVGTLDIKNFPKNLFTVKNKERVFPLLSFTCVKNIKLLGKCHCYDLWIPKTNNYAINDFLIHNSIEQDADLVLMLYRDDYYNKDVNTIENNITEVIISKHRNGPLGNINLMFEPKTLTFNNFVF
jgi:replicative DNA helicase